MWVLKIRAREKWTIYSSRTVKYGVKLYYYALNNYEEGGRIFFVASGIIEGEDKQKKNFFADLKKEPKLEFLELNKDFFVCVYSETKTAKRVHDVKAFYNPKLVFLRPVIIDEEGWEDAEIASFEKPDLEIFLKYSKESNVEVEVSSFKQERISNLMIFSMLPNLTEKQKQALQLAVENKYYGYPKKINIETLAKNMKISKSTYQFHLAKAEGKIMPFLAKRA